MWNFASIVVWVTLKQGLRNRTRQLLEDVGKGQIPAPTLPILNEDGAIVEPDFLLIDDKDVPFPLITATFCSEGMETDKMEKIIMTALKELKKNGKNVLNPKTKAIMVGASLWLLLAADRAWRLDRA